MIVVVVDAIAVIAGVGLVVCVLDLVRITRRSRDAE